MIKIVNKVVKAVSVMVLASLVMLVPVKSVKADAVTDAIAAQQAVLYQQQVEQLQQYQAALLAQYQLAYQQAVADQYAKALLVFKEQQAEQQRAIQQAYMLNSIQQAQKAHYTSMVQSTGLDYQQHLLDEYAKYQKQAITAFKGYEGIK